MPKDEFLLPVDHDASEPFADISPEDAERMLRNLPWEVGAPGFARDLARRAGLDPAQNGLVQMHKAVRYSKDEDLAAYQLDTADRHPEEPARAVERRRLAARLRQHRG